MSIGRTDIATGIYSSGTLLHGTGRDSQIIRTPTEFSPSPSRLRELKNLSSSDG
jgi:hypothetical protein